jgi:voltage-gated potassium channel
MTAYIVGGEINNELRRRKTTRMIDRLSNHYIVCGVGRVGGNVARELSVTGRPHVVIDVNAAKLDAYGDKFPDTPRVHGDAADDATLFAAGIGRAAGVFAITGDDAKNLVITLSAKQLNAAARVVARCHDVSFTEKMRRVGADAIVSPDFTGGMRIASAMVRPNVITFLDQMLRSEEALRVEELAIPERLSGRLLGELEPRTREFLVLAVRNEGQWRFNPPDDYVVRGGDTLVFMATPEGRNVLRERLLGSTTEILVAREQMV